jgi:hypothetical protein
MSQTTPSPTDQTELANRSESTSPNPTSTKSHARSARSAQPAQSALWQTKLQDPTLAALADYTSRDLARALLERLSLDERDWHRLKGDRRRRAQEQVAAALVFMLTDDSNSNRKDNDHEARQRLTHALDWLDRRVSAPPCPDHTGRSPKPPSTDP